MRRSHVFRDLAFIGAGISAKQESAEPAAFCCPCSGDSHRVSVLSQTAARKFQRVPPVGICCGRDGLRPSGDPVLPYYSSPGNSSCRRASNKTTMTELDKLNDLRRVFALMGMRTA